MHQLVLIATSIYRSTYSKLLIWFKYRQDSWLKIIYNFEVKYEIVYGYITVHLFSQYAKDKNL